MRQLLVLVAAIGVLAAGQQLPPRDTPRPSAPATATVQGRVVADDTGGPIRDCQVDLWLEAGRVFHSSRTDAEGRFEIGSLPPGKYRLSARPAMIHAGYLPYEGNRSGPIDLAAGEKLDHLIIRLLRGAAINGRVLDQQGEPIGGIDIHVFRRDPLGGLLGAPQWRSVQTDDLGRFRVSRLEAGSYALAAAPPITRLPEQASDRTQFQRTFYPSAPDAPEAAVLSLAAGQEAEGIEIRLLRERTFTVSGVIFDSRGLPAVQAGGTVYGSIMRLSGSQYVHFHTDLDLGVKPDGSFATASLPPGTYSLRAQSRPTGSASTEFGALKVVVAGADLEGLSLLLRPAASVSGTVLLEPDGSAGAPPGLRIGARPYPSEMGFGLERGGAEVARNGAFTLTNLHGPMLVRPEAPEGWFLKAVMRGDEDITEKPTEFKAGANERLHVIMTRRASEVTGRVTGDEGIPSRTTVYVFAQDSAMWHWVFTTSRTASTTEGQYVVRGLRPGRYFAVALASEASFDRGPGAYQVLSRYAVPFELGDGERRTLDLPLTVIKKK